MRKKTGAPIGAPLCLLAAAAVVLAAAAVVFATADTVVAATAEQDQQNDDPAEVTATEAIVTHKEYLQKV